MRNLFLELGELRRRGMHWSKFMAEYRTQTRICLDIWQYNYVITISGEGGFSSDYNKYITEIKFCGFKHGMS